jgi:hypothetical protein
VLRNPFAGVDQGDLTELFEHGALLGAQLAAEAVAALGAPTVSYGKAAIVGALGAAEHGAALLHPQLGKPVRVKIGGGQALMPSTVKLGSVGSRMGFSTMTFREDHGFQVRISEYVLSVTSVGRSEDADC